ncbi:hypothetical protein ACFYVK_41740 [Streptomyces chartreusis]|uniref:hypothetical protein n=1 Tax=Streptomyces chartreusis TaxID=1969 RepID=UPI00367FDC82
MEISGVGIVRRLGDPPQLRGSGTMETCPDIVELSDGSFAIIGTEVTNDLVSRLLPEATRADGERLVVIDRDTLIRAKRDIPDA